MNDFERKYEIIASRVKSNKVGFYYGVRTTGIFCKPGCSSRLPRKENVLFFNTAKEAIEEGFRPCKRCNPLNDNNTSIHSEIVKEVCKLIKESENIPTLKALAKKTGYSESYIQRIFKKITGISPNDYSKTIKSERFREEILNSPSVTSSIYKAGFGSSSRVYENIDDILAMTPKQARNFGEGKEIRMGVFPCYLGLVLIAFTDKGVSTVDIGDEETKLINDFQKRFKNANLGDLTDLDKNLVILILDKIKNPDKDKIIPLDAHGTIFQTKVWKALQEIPSGITKTYSDIAIEIGHPKSVRAVANACGKNEIALLVPCHRVIRKNGELGGYRWGLDKKALILQNELKHGRTNA